MGNLYKRVELAANIAIIIVAVVLAVTLGRRLLAPTAAPGQPGQQASRIAKGERLTLPDVDWAGNKRTLVLALSNTCHFCTESADFYRKVVQEHRGKGVQLLAVLPQPEDDARRYLSSLGVEVDGVKQSPLSSIPVSGTPTLILVNGEGAVEEVWVGKLPPEQEREVLARL